MLNNMIVSTTCSEGYHPALLVLIKEVERKTETGTQDLKDFVFLIEDESTQGKYTYAHRVFSPSLEPNSPLRNQFTSWLSENQTKFVEEGGWNLNDLVGLKATVYTSTASSHSWVEDIYPREKSDHEDARRPIQKKVVSRAVPNMAFAASLGMTRTATFTCFRCLDDITGALSTVDRWGEWLSIADLMEICESQNLHHLGSVHLQDLFEGIFEDRTELSFINAQGLHQTIEVSGKGSGIQLRFLSPQAHREIQLELFNDSMATR